MATPTPPFPQGQKLEGYKHTFLWGGSGKADPSKTPHSWEVKRSLQREPSKLFLLEPKVRKEKNLHTKYPAAFSKPRQLLSSGLAPSASWL